MGETLVTLGAGGGSYQISNRENRTYNNLEIGVAAMTARAQPVQFEFLARLRQASAHGHEINDFDLGIGARLLPRRPLAYMGTDGVLRVTASIDLGFSILSADLPVEMSGGLAFCSNRGRFAGVMFELVARPSEQKVTTSGVGLGPWIGGRIVAFF